MPDGREDFKHVGAGNLRDRHLADAREGQPPQARQPLAGVFPVAPASPLLFQYTGSSFGEGEDTLGAALLPKWVPALAGQLAVGERLLSGLGQRDQGEAAESDLTAAATDDEALNPAAGSAGLDGEKRCWNFHGCSLRGCGRAGFTRPRAQARGFHKSADTASAWCRGREPGASQ